MPAETIPAASVVLEMVLLPLFLLLFSLHPLTF